MSPGRTAASSRSSIRSIRARCSVGMPRAVLAVNKLHVWEGRWPERPGESADFRAARIAAAMAQRGTWAVLLGAPKYIAELADVMTDDAASTVAIELSVALSIEAQAGSDAAAVGRNAEAAADGLGGR